jgi:hypothetical protein
METGPLPASKARSRGLRPSHVLPALLVGALVVALGMASLARARRGNDGVLAAAPASAELADPAAEPAPAPVPWVDPGAAHVLAKPEWADPRWLEHVDALLASLEPCETTATGWLEPLRAALAGLSFVERVERCELDPEVGLALDLVLRRPVACIPVGPEFALVDEDGVVLEGRWPVPPRLGHATLPVLGPLGDPLLARARAGDWLAEPEHLDALDVALSLNASLGEDERASLGRITIDARSARRTSVAEPGVRLELEGERVALFGRAPSAGAPGELAAAAKWRSLARARELFARDPEGGDWELVDLRWDRPDIALEHPPEVAAILDRTEERRPRGGRSRAARDDGDPSRPRVR